jgi:hypothetical protein
MSQVIHIKQAIFEIESKDERGKPIPFSARVLKKDGGVALFENAVCSSSYHKGTMNFFIPANGQTRTIRTIHLIEFNGKEVMI